MVKDLSALVVSMIVTLLASFLGMMIYSSLYPNPVDLNVNDKSSMSLFINDLPNQAFAIKIFANIITAFCASLLATIISKSKVVFGTIGLLLCVMLMAYRDFDTDYPRNYFIITGITVLFSGILGILIGSRNK